MIGYEEEIEEVSQDDAVLSHTEETDEEGSPTSSRNKDQFLREGSTGGPA